MKSRTGRHSGLFLFWPALAGPIKLKSNGEGAVTAGIAVNELLISGKTSSSLLFQPDCPSVSTWHNQYQLSIRLSS